MSDDNRPPRHRSCLEDGYRFDTASDLGCLHVAADHPYVPDLLNDCVSPFDAKRRETLNGGRLWVERVGLLDIQTRPILISSPF